MQILRVSIAVLFFTSLVSANIPIIAQAPHLRGYAAPILEKVVSAPLVEKVVSAPIIENIAAPIVSKAIYPEVIAPGLAAAPMESDNHVVHEEAYNHDHDSGYKYTASDNVNVAGYGTYGGVVPGHHNSYGSIFPGHVAGIVPGYSAGYGVLPIGHASLHPNYAATEYILPGLYNGGYPEYVSSFPGEIAAAHYYPSTPLVAATGY